MRLHLLLSLFSLFLAHIGFSQTLTVESSGQSGPTFTNITVSGNTWTLTGNASVKASAIVTALASGSLTIKGNSSTFVANINEAISATTVGNGLTLGDGDNTSNITISSAISLAGPISLYGGAIAINANMSTSNAKAILVKAKTNINQASSVTVSTTGGAGGSVSYWADSDDNSTGYVQLHSNAAINTGGGNISLGGGTNLLEDFAFGSTAETTEETYIYVAGVHMRQSVQLTSDGGDISVRGHNATSGTVDCVFGVSMREVTINSGTGKIAINGVATGSSNVNAQGVSSWGPITLRSANTSSDAISVFGDASAINLTTTGSTLGINFTGLFEATGTGGGITFTGKAGSASVVSGMQVSGNILAKSGPITLIGESTNNVKSIYFPGSLTLGKNTGTNVLESSSNVIIETNDLRFENNQYIIDCSGTFTVRPRSNSFPSTYTSPQVNITSWPITNFTLTSTVGGLNIGKTENTSDITIASATTINGPINVYAGNINLNDNLSTTSGSSGDVLLKSSGNITQASGKSISTAGGDVTLWSNSDASGAGYVYITGGANSGVTSNGGNILFGGGTDITTGYAKGSETEDTGTQSSCISGIHLRSGSSLLSGGGNITLRGENFGSSFARVQAGVMGAGTTLDAGSGKIAIYGKASGSGNNNAQGISRAGNDNWIIRSSNPNTDAIQLIGDASACNSSATSLGINFIGTMEATNGGGIYLYGTAGTGTGYDHGLDIRGNILANSGTITLKGENNSSSQVSVFIGTQDDINLSTTLGSKTGTNVLSSTSNIIIQGDFNDFNTAAPINTSGRLTIEPVSTSFGGTQTFPNANLTLANSVSGFTMGKSGNTSGITISSALSVAGGIDIYAGTITLDGNLTTTNNGNIRLYSDNALAGLSSARTITAAGVMTYAPQGTSFGSAVTYPITNLTVNSKGLTIGKLNNAANITIGTATSVDGPITLYGGTLGLNNTLTTTNATSGNISFNGTTLSGNSNISLANDRILTTNLSSAASYSGIISGTGSGLTQAGTGVLTLTGANTYTGTTTVSAGGLTLNRTGGGTLSSASDLLVSGGALTVSTNQTFNDIALSSGTLTNNAGVTLTLENTFAGGGTLVNNGTFKILGPATVQSGSMGPGPVNFPGSSTTVSAMNNLTIDNLLGVMLDKNLDVAGTLNLAAGTFYLSTKTLTVNGFLTRNAGTIYASAGTLAFGNSSDLSLPTSLFNGNVQNLSKMNGAGTLTINDNLIVTNNMNTSASIGALIIAPSKQITVQGILNNSGTFTMKDGATFVQATSGTSITGNGTFNVEKALTGNTSSWSNTSGRFWYMGVPMVNVARSSYGNYGATSNQVWSYAEVTKSYSEVTDGNILLSAGTGYVHRRSLDGTLIFSAAGNNGLYRSDVNLNGLTKTAGNSAGYHLISNPYMAYLDWHAMYDASTNIDPTFYIRTNNTNNISAIISYNAGTGEATNNSSVNATPAQLRHIAPMQSIWVRVSNGVGTTGTLAMSRSMLSHQTGNVGLKSSTVFPTKARVNLVDGNNFDQMLVYLNSDMSNEVDQYDSEKMAVGGTVQVYTMSSNKKLVMNGLKNNKKKVSVPLYLELPQTKSYTLQLSEYQVEDGLILLEDKQEGTIQDFTLMENYTFYANSGLLQNRFVLHFILPNAELATQGPSNSWVAAEEGSYTEGGDVEISNDDRGNIEITLNQAAEQKVEGTVFVTDMNGKEVYNGQLEGITTAIELDVPSGIYYLTVQSGTLIEKKKVFIQE